MVWLTTWTKAIKGHTQPTSIELLQVPRIDEAGVAHFVGNSRSGLVCNQIQCRALDGNDLSITCDDQIRIVIGAMLGDWSRWLFATEIPTNEL
jgi:hypothetical protein